MTTMRIDRPRTTFCALIRTGLLAFLAGCGTDTATPSVSPSAPGASPTTPSTPTSTP